MSQNIQTTTAVTIGTGNAQSYKDRKNFAELQITCQNQTTDIYPSFADQSYMSLNILSSMLKHCTAYQKSDNNVMYLLKAFLGNGSANRFQHATTEAVSVDECYSSLPGNHQCTNELVG
jgi:hypothetical protein